MAVSIARVGTASSPIIFLAPAKSFAARHRKFQPARCESASPLSDRRESRRLVSVSLVLSHFVLNPNYAFAAINFDKYVKRKKLDPLDAYVPAVILSQFQIKDLEDGTKLCSAQIVYLYRSAEKTLEGEEPQFAACRSLLRSGPAASLRVNIRAVAQYASESGNGKTASDAVDQCLSALEDLDNLMLRASRNDSGASVKLMKTKIGAALNSLDGLLETVPPAVLLKGRLIADTYRTPDEEDNDAQRGVIEDPELRQLESIL